MDLAPFASRVARTDLRGLFTRNIMLKLAAIALALAVSLIASASEPEVSGIFEGKIPVERANLPEGYVLRGSLGDVEVSYRGPQDAVRRLALSSFRAEADLSGYDLGHAGDLRELLVRVSVADPRIAVVQIRPSVVAVRIVPVESKRMPVRVRFENQPPVGYQAGETSVQPAEITVRGPADSLREVVSAVAQVRFAEAGNDLSSQPRVVPLDAAGREVTGVEAQPPEVQVAVSLRPALPTRTVAVVPLIRGAPAIGFWVASVSTDPAVVTLRAEAGALVQIDRVETNPVDIGGASSDRTVRVALSLPAGTTLARGSADVDVAISVRPASGTRMFPAVAVRPINVGRDLVVDLDPSFVEIVLSGDVLTLLAIRPEQLVAVVDVGGKSVGTYQLDLSLQIPAGATVLSVTPARVVVQLRSKT